MTTTFSIRMDKELLETVKQIAERETRTTNQQIIHLIEKGLARHYDEQEAISRLDDRGQTNKEKIVG